MSQDWGRIVEADAIRIAKPCLRCGYSLRGVGDAIRCPECGLRTWLSLTSADGLRLSSPRWVGCMAMLLMAWGISAGAFAVLAVLPPAVVALAGDRSLRELGTVACLLMTPLWLVSVTVLSACVAACRERRRPEPQGPISWFLFGSSVFALAMVGVAALLLRGAYTTGPVLRTWVALLLVPLISACWGMFLTSLMSRSESPLAARWARRVNLLQLVLLLIGPFAATYASLAETNDVRWMVVASELLGAANGTSLLAIAVLSVKSSIVALHEQALARQEWSA